MHPSKGSAAVAQSAMPQSAGRGCITAVRYPALETIAAYDASLPEPLRARVRAVIAEPVERLRSDLEFVESALRATDPEYAVFLLVQLLRELPETLKHVDARLARELRRHRA